jgi:PEP-CTERM motif
MLRKYQVLLVLGLILCALVILPVTSQASTIVINPVDDGSIYTCSNCNTNPNRSYVQVAGGIVGDVDFQIPSLDGPIGNAQFSVNPYGLPLGALEVSIYGAASTSGFISLADLSSPTFLGTLTLPSGLGYGQDASFDVTNFLRGVQTPYADFILESPGNGGDVFSSLSENYGHPSQLTITNAPEVTTTPEPSSLVLFGTGLIALIGAARRKLFVA